MQQMPFTVGAGGQVLQPPSQRGISRRTAIISLVGLVGLATIGSGFALSALSQSSQGTQVQTSQGEIDRKKTVRLSTLSVDNLMVNCAKVACRA